MTTTSKTRAVALLGAAFLLGAVAGGAAMQLRENPGEHRGDRRNCAVRNGRVCMWASVLQLTTEQQEQMLQVYRDGEPKFDSIYRPIQPPVDSIYQLVRPAVDSQRHAIRDQIRPLLTPEQREKYDSVNTADDERRRQARSNGGPGGPSGPGGPPRGRP
jgi:Spy/CpxP family protein refolding chaperone